MPKLSPYEAVVSSRAATFIIGLSKARQRRLVNLLMQLAENPWQVGDYSQKDETGRDIHFLRVGDLVIGFWVDHPVKEFRVIDIDEL